MERANNGSFPCDTRLNSQQFYNRYIYVINRSIGPRIFFCFFKDVVHHGVEGLMFSRPEKRKNQYGIVFWRLQLKFRERENLKTNENKNHWVHIQFLRVQFLLNCSFLFEYRLCTLFWNGICWR